MGKAGVGEGGKAPEEKTDTDLEKQRVKVPIGKGKIVGLWFTPGGAPKGQAAAEYAEAHAQFSQEAMDSLHQQRIPRSSQEYVRGYFDAIRLQKDAAKKPAEPDKQK